MDIWSALGGMLDVEVTSAEPEQTWEILTKQGMELFCTEQISALTYRVRIRRRDFGKLRKILEKKGGTVEVRGRLGWYWGLRGLLRRPVLLIGSTILLAAGLYLPSRVLFVRVEGNTSVSQRDILEAAEACGIEFGASRREVRSEKVKNALLAQLPQLQWAGVNTAGCVATISVRERAEQPETEHSGNVSSLVAARDGYILSATVTNGTPLVRVGQTVTAGQTLVSGYTDCGIFIQAGQAQGEIYAQTQRELTALTPAQRLQREQSQQQRYAVSLRIGKKYIKIWKDSGISNTTCGRMYEEYPVTLPGGFTLPITVCVDTYTLCQAQLQPVDAEMAQSDLERFAKTCITSQMVAGEIVDGIGETVSEDGVYTLTGTYTCVEMIARERQEQIGDTNGKAN